MRKWHIFLGRDKFKGEEGNKDNIGGTGNIRIHFFYYFFIETSQFISGEQGTRYLEDTLHYK